MSNKHGLPRKPSAQTLRTIRQNSKFSCVICRAPFCTYEHFDPPYKDADRHDPDGMCLLCWSCQGDTTAGRLSKDVIRARYAARRAEVGVRSEKDNFMFFSRMPVVKLGASTICLVDTVICTDAVDCLSFHRDTETGMFLMNMRIFDQASQQVCEVIENTWVSEYRPWDFEFSGRVVTFRSSLGKVIFRAELDSENCLVDITHLDMTLENSRLRLEGGDVVVTRESFDGSRYVEIGASFDCLEGRAAFFLDNREDVPTHASSIPVMHGSFGGITIGRASACYLKNFTLKTYGISRGADQPMGQHPGPKEAYVKGQLVVVFVQFPFWEEKEYFLNGVKLSQEPYSVDDVGECDFGGTVEIFHLSAPDAALFTLETGLVGHVESDLERPPMRPHRFL